MVWEKHGLGNRIWALKVLLVLLQWLFTPFSCLQFILTLAITCSSEQRSSAPSPKHFIYLSLSHSEGEALLHSTFPGIYCGLPDQNYHAAFLSFFFFYPLIKSSGRNFSKTKGEQTKRLHYEMRADLTLPNFQHSGALPLLWRKLRGLQWYVQANRNSLGWYCFNHVSE